MADPSHRQLVILAAYTGAGSVAATARRLQLTEAQVRRELSGLYRLLGVRNAMQAYAALGWLVIPDEWHPSRAVDNG
jgi:DNA-binding NarL/FixJ family response regulator